MSKIYFDPSRRLSLIHYALIFLVAVDVFTYLAWPEEQKRKGEADRKTPLTPSVFAYPSTLSPLPHTEERPAPKTDENEIIHEAADSPQPLKYGMAALGKGDAWPGFSKKDPFVDVDVSGNVCKDITTLTTLQLRTLFTVRGLDPCGYRSAYWNRGDAVPKDVLAEVYIYSTDDIKRYYEGGAWGIADFEELARDRELAQNATLNVYLILKQVGSPMAEYLTGRKFGVDRGNLEKYLQTGQCDDPSADIRNFCFYNK